MAVGTANQQDLTALIMRATNPLNEVDDPNLVQAICQEIGKDISKTQLAMRLIVHKMQSPHEREAMQALLILQACVNNCGEVFQAEVGKFRFLNELIKLVSPKYAGNQTPYAVKIRVFQLLYTWTVDLKHESKIYEAYEMLKNQGVLKDDPLYLGAQVEQTPKHLPPASFEDEQKSRMLQQLLQSKRPEDISKANALIKSMVKEDEKRLERTSRRIVEVETALNNVKVLDDMLNQYRISKAVTSADLDLMRELFNSCNTLRSNIFRTVSEMDDKDDGLGDFLKASDELSTVMGRYKLDIEGKSSHSKGTPDESVENSNSEKQGRETSLLDLSPDHKPSSKTASNTLKNLAIEPQTLQKKSAAVLQELGEVFGNSLPLHPQSPSESSQAKSDLSILTSTNGALGLSLVPSSVTIKPLKNDDLASSSISTDKPSNPLGELDRLGSDLLKQSLPPNYTPVGSQFKPQDKVSMNQMKQSVKVVDSIPYDVTLNTNKPVNIAKGEPVFQNLQPDILGLTTLSQHEFMKNGTATSVPINLSENLLNNDFENRVETSTSQNENYICDTDTNTGNLVDGGVTSDTELLSDLSLNSYSSDQESKTSKYESWNKESVVPKSDPSLIQTGKEPKIQLCDVKPLNDIHISLEDIKPGNQSTVPLIDSDGLSLVLHFTQNKPRDDVTILVVTVTSRCSQPVSNYMLQAVGPKGCKVRLQSPSNTNMSEYSPFLPPPAITQIMLIANPNQLNISLKVMLSYCLGDEPVSTMGEIDNLPL